MALLIILLVLILLVPRACQALFGPGEESSGPTAPETSVTEESTTGITEETVEQGSTAGGGETEMEVSVAETASDAGASEEESVEALDMEAAAGFTGMAVSFEAPIAPIGESPVADTNINQAAPTPDVGLQQQAVIQPVIFEEPIAPEQPTPLVEAQVPLEEPAFLGELAFLGEPALFEEPPFFEEPMFLEEAVSFEEPTVVSERPVASVSGPAPTSSGPIAVIDSH